jgi:hypothetical protein
MTALAAAPSRFDDPGAEGSDQGAGRSLDAALAGAWQGLAAHRAVDCLVCGESTMMPEYGAHALPVGGRCTRCGSVLR